MSTQSLTVHVAATLHSTLYPAKWRCAADAAVARSDADHTRPNWLPTARHQNVFIRLLNIERNGSIFSAQLRLASKGKLIKENIIKQEYCY